LVHGRHGQGFKPEHGAIAARNRLGRGDDLQILDPDAVIADLVIAWLIGHDHAGFQRNGVRRLGDALRAFMDPQIAAHAVTGAMIIIEPGHPQRLTRQRIQRMARRAFGEADHRDRAICPFRTSVK
jgi:hypothetical protein